MHKIKLCRSEDTMSITDIVPPGVITGDNVVKLLEHARATGYAIPAVNCTSSSSANACLEAASKNNSPLIIQCSFGGGEFLAGKGIGNKNAAAVGSIALAVHVRAVARFYGIPVILHSDHCAKKLLPCFDGMLEADKEYFDKFGEPLFSSHMLDLSEEPDEENIAICAEYFKKMAPMKIWLEMEIGITGGEEDGVNNEDVDPEKLLGHQEYTKTKINSPLARPLFLVMHGGSGSTDDEISTAVRNGVVKMKIDTDTQWAYWDGLRAFESENRGYLQGQIGNPDGADKPNKKYYDPRNWVRKAEVSMCTRVSVSMEKLGSRGKYPVSDDDVPLIDPSSRGPGSPDNKNCVIS